MCKKIVFTRQRKETIATTIMLLGMALTIYLLSKFDVIHYREDNAIGMLLSTAVYIFGGCVLQTMKMNRLAIGVGMVVFFLLCVFLFYSVTTIDFVIFFFCMALVIRKSSKACGPDGCFVVSGK